MTDKEHDWRTLFTEEKKGRETGRRVYQCKDCRQWKEEDIFASRKMAGVCKAPDVICPGVSNEENVPRVS